MFEGWPPPVLDPAGPYAGSITLLSWILFAHGRRGTLLVVLAALYVALFGRRATQAKLGGTKGDLDRRHRLSGGRPDRAS